MAIKRQQPEKEVTYFCTFTCFEWRPLFEMTGFYDELYKWLNILSKQAIYTIGFVFMPNHLHCLLYLPQNCKPINTVLGNGKRFMAYELVNRLEQQNELELLDYMAKEVPPSDSRHNKKHQVFEPSSDTKPCYTEKFLVQKLDYMHHNPVSGKWALTDDYVKYPHSSAMFYELNEEHPQIRLTHYKDLGI